MLEAYFSYLAFLGARTAAAAENVLSVFGRPDGGGCGKRFERFWACGRPVSYTHLRAHETKANLVCRLLLEKKKSLSGLNMFAPILVAHFAKDVLFVCRRTYL